MLEIGQIVSYYSIVEKIGKGGAGEVYRARDTKLSRDIALKVLPTEFAKDADRIARFQSEAKLLASLNHPSICWVSNMSFLACNHFLRWGGQFDVRKKQGSASTLD
jgi:serine/threonine protein kinase